MTHDFFGLRMAVAESSGLASRLGSLAMVATSGFEGEDESGSGAGEQRG